MGSMIATVLGFGCGSDEVAAAPKKHHRAGSGGGAASTGGGCPTDGLASDARNCGTCGHDCEGGACVEGACQPFALVSDLVDPAAIVIDEAAVYWSTRSGQVASCPKAGCPNGPIQLGKASHTNDLALGATDVYWANFEFGSISRCAKAGCAETPTVMASSPYSAFLAVEGGDIVWTTSDAATLRGQLLACPIAGCAGGPAVLYTSGLLGGPLAVRGGAAYFLVGDGYGDFLALRKCALPTCNGGPITLATLDMYPQDIAVDDENAYFATAVGSNPSLSSVMMCGVGGCNGAPVTLFNLSGSYVTGLALDGDFLYASVMSDQGTGEIVRCARGGCDAMPIPVAKEQGNPSAVAVDNAAVYWANAGAGEIMKLVR
jgi:hypothetical protein